MCRTVTALGVLYHNYRIINTPLPSQEGLYCMHDTGCGEDGDGGVKEGALGGTHWQSAPAGSGGMGISTVQLATTTVLYRHFEGNRECHS